MRIPVLAASAAAALAYLAGSGGAAPAGFRFGVAAGEVTPRGAQVWARAGRAGPVTVEVARDARFRTVVVRKQAVARASDDLTVQVQVGGLRPGTSYVYRFRQGDAASAVGRFRTAPLPATPATVRFAISGDADATRAPGSSEPAFNRFEVYAHMAAERNDFNVNLGDTIYSDSDVAGPPALTVPAKWAKYRENLSLPALVRLRGSAGLYSHWDDHEFVNDFSREEDGEDVYQAGVRAFVDYAPVRYSERDGLYRTFRWGKNLELFFLDERSFRSAKASAGGACDGPTGQPDLAPTAPQAVREAFAALAPPLRAPVAQACLDRIDDPRRTMLGPRQLARFRAEIARSTATFKVIVNEVPIQQFYALPYDRWEGYAAERRQLLEFLRSNVKNVVFLTTDTHANLANDVRVMTLEPGGPLDSGILEVVTGPVATHTLAKQVDRVLGSPGTGVVVGALFFKPEPPRGLGMRCAALDVFSYAEVEVTSARLTITPKDAAGRVVQDLTGTPCGPFTIEAR